jgi:hypothetical protein
MIRELHALRGRLIDEKRFHREIADALLAAGHAKRAGDGRKLVP